MNLSTAIKPLEKGRLRVRPACDAADLAAVLALRGLCFRGEVGAPDRDGFDDNCTHMMVEGEGGLLGAFRLRLYDGDEISQSYAAQFYDVSRLGHFPKPMLELGRFCIAPGAGDGDVLRLAWGAITRQVDGADVGLLFGCSSFRGCDPAPYFDALGLLRDRHTAPANWAPGVNAHEVVRFADLPPLTDRARGLRAIPPLLRTYLAMGGWVSDHAVIDRALGTMHLFTGVEIACVPAGRARLLRAVAGA